jgi:catechol-2,3-dioxygenase
VIGKLKTVVLDAPDIARLSTFYTSLAGWTQQGADDDWITLKTPDGWRVGLQLAPDHVPPQWPDPEHPQQFHIDLRVPDLDAATDRAVELGATRLGGGETWHTLADPAGHPFDLCKNDDDPPMTVFAVTVDTDEPGGLSRFYAGLLGMQVRYDGDEGSLIGADGEGQLMFQRIERYRAPQWPDPVYPQQFHLDVMVEDVEVAEPAVLALGATRLKGEGEHWRVYADPSGHPFCLVW